MSKKKNLVLALGALVLVVAVLLGVWFAFSPKAVAGEKTITAQVIYADETSKEFVIQTSEEYLRGALEQQNLIAGSDGEYGMFVTSVDGVVADDAKQEWWCFTKGGEMVMTSVDTTPIQDGEHYEITLTTGY